MYAMAPLIILQSAQQAISLCRPMSTSTIRTRILEVVNLLANLEMRTILVRVTNFTAMERLTHLGSGTWTISITLTASKSEYRRKL